MKAWKPWSAARCDPSERVTNKGLTLSNHAAYARRAALPPALLHRLIVLAGALTPIGRLGAPIALEKEAEAVIAPAVAARNGDIDRGPAHHEARPVVPVDTGARRIHPSAS